MMKKVTIQDVADYLDVSKSAVSHALSGRRRISPELSRRVHEAIDVLGYKPNFAAQVLSRQSTRLIGVTLNDFTSPHTIGLLDHISRELKSSGYSLTLCMCTSLEKEEGVELLGRISNGMVDAIINMLPQLSVDEAVCAAKGTPVLTYLRHEVSPITLDFAAGTRQALNCFFEFGHRRIGIIGTFARNYGGEDPCLQAYREFMTEHKLYDPNLIVSGDGTTACGHRAAEVLVPQGVTAIFAGNDVMASGILQWAHARRMTLPAELSVIGCDNSNLATATWPALTSLYFFVPQIARHTAQVLLAMIRGEGEKLPPVNIIPQLVIRDSVGPRTTF